MIVVKLSLYLGMADRRSEPESKSEWESEPESDSESEPEPEPELDKKNDVNFSPVTHNHACLPTQCHGMVPSESTQQTNSKQSK